MSRAGKVSMDHHFNGYINEYSREKSGAYYALKGHTVQAKGNHLEGVCYD
jgi:hypothetical protein